MNIIIFSDSHNYNENMVNAIKYFENKIDAIVHLGDCIEDTYKLKKIFNDKQLFTINGNNDEYVTKSEFIFELSGYYIYITHGHILDVNRSIDKLYYRAKEIGADIALYGHTHKMFVDESDILVLNPGSISYPRDSNLCTFAIIELTDNIKYTFYYIKRGEIVEIKYKGGN